MTSWPNDSRRQSETRLTATSTPMIDCHGATERGDAPSGTHSSCCDACALSTAPGLGARSVSHFIHQLEVSTRFAFETLLGRELDGGPADYVRARPPRSHKSREAPGQAQGRPRSLLPANRLPSSGRFARPLSRRERARSDVDSDSVRVAPVREGTTMAFINLIFRRVSHPGDASLADEVIACVNSGKISAPDKRKKHGGGGFYYWSFSYTNGPAHRRGLAGGAGSHGLFPRSRLVALADAR